MWVLGCGKQLIHSEHHSLWSWSYTLRLKSIGWTVLKICRTHTDRDSVHLYSIRFSNPIISVHWTVDSMSFHPQSWCLYDLLGLEKEQFNQSYCDAVLYCLMFNGVKSLSIIVYMIKDNIQPDFVSPPTPVWTMLESVGWTLRECLGWNQVWGRAW